MRSPSVKKYQQDSLEHVTWHGQHIATIINAGFIPEKTTFITPDSYYQHNNQGPYTGLKKKEYF